MSQRRNRRQVALIPEFSVALSGGSILLPDDSVEDGTSSIKIEAAPSGYRMNSQNLAPALPTQQRAFFETPQSPHIIIAPPALHLAALAPGLHQGAATASPPTEVTPEMRNSSITGSRSIRPKGNATSKGVRNDKPPGSDGSAASSNGAGGQKTPNQVLSGYEELGWNISSWKKRQKKQRSLLVDESKLLHDYNKRLVDCSLCLKAISSSQLRQHMEAVHEISVFYDCDVCGESGFKSKIALRQHVLQLHRLHCCFCRKRFPSKKLLFVHRKKHNDGHPFDCRRCAKSFSAKPLLAQHIFVQHPKTEFACRQCKEFFPSLRGKSVHDRIVHRKPRLRCRQCGRRFLFKRFYFLHLSEGSCRPPAQNCPHCRRKFENRVVFRSHKERCRFKNSYSRKRAAKIVPPPITTVAPSAVGATPPSEPRSLDDFGSFEAGAGLSAYSTIELRSQTQTDSNFLVGREKFRSRREQEAPAGSSGLSTPGWMGSDIVFNDSLPDLQDLDSELDITEGAEVTVPQIDFPFAAKTPDDVPNKDAAIRKSAAGKSFEMGETFGEIFGQSPSVDANDTTLSDRSFLVSTRGNIIVAGPKRCRSDRRGQVIGVELPDFDQTGSAGMELACRPGS